MKKMIATLFAALAVLSASAAESKLDEAVNVRQQLEELRGDMEFKARSKNTNSYARYYVNKWIKLLNEAISNKDTNALNKLRSSIEQIAKECSDAKSKCILEDWIKELSI